MRPLERPKHLFILSLIPFAPDSIDTAELQRLISRSEEGRSYDYASRQAALYAELNWLITKEKLFRVKWGVYSRPKSRDQLATIWRPQPKPPKPAPMTMRQALKVALEAQKKELFPLDYFLET